MKVFLIYMKDLRICNYIQLNYERGFYHADEELAGGVVFSGDKFFFLKMRGMSGCFERQDARRRNFE